MKKYLPYAPLALFMIGILFISWENNWQNNGLMSNTLWNNSDTNREKRWCTKPEWLTENNESAWCNKWLVSNIKELNKTWNWACSFGEKTEKCIFEETKPYKTRGGQLFTK